MILFSVESRTPVTVFLEEGSEITAEFVENYDSKVFYVQSQSLLDNLNTLTNSKATVELFFKEGFYRAECRIVGPGIRKPRYDTVALEAQDEFKYEAQRSSPRVYMGFTAEIHHYTEDKNSFYKSGLICRSISKDLSRDGIYLVSEHKITAPKETMFTISFYFSNYTFNIPAKLMWNRQSDKSTHDYGFLFDFSGIPELQDKLLTAIFKEKLK